MHPRFTTAFATLDNSLQQALKPVLDDPNFTAILQPETLQHLMTATGLDGDALALALLPLAASCAVTPISHFNVGAIARGVSGRWYFGANMEFSGATMQQTVHAEQSAITHAWLSGEEKLAAITVNYTPCGHCRQFMNELNSGLSLTVCLPDHPPRTLADYLPAAFGPADLNIHSVLMDINDQQFVPQGDPLTQAAIRAASLSYAPYSAAYSGVALQTRDGKIYAGRYAENAAYNPSLPPLQSALILLNIRGGDCTDIQRAVLAESDDAALLQHSATQTTLAALGCQHLDSVRLTRT
ncbi:cytidine deaminase [Tatumella sp. JGM118]|uniref:Cytidine deaminase n=1 Tax=Tatumella terrea TaxID=419007 RepID=A0ABW1VWC7_9GAMM|nr:cytidine deaminase [Tatumella sp. JGM118]MBS0909764.1 cytidine deaminase [Tatumella sp. JGM118]